MVTGNFVYARSRTQRVVSFFITESELHSMVSSCSDAIFVKRCLSGKIVWIQALVLQQEVSVGQIPTAWNYSDIGTKPLSRNRLVVLLSQLCPTDPDNYKWLDRRRMRLLQRECNDDSLCDEP